MTTRGALAPRTRASRDVVRWVRAAVIALLAALALLIHHETADVAIRSLSSSTTHVMTPGMVMAASQATPATAMPGPEHGSTAAQAAEATAAASAVNSADGPACSGMAMQHCSTASLEVVKVATPTPTQTPAPWSLGFDGPTPTGSKAAGTLGRAPPDLFVLSQLRI